MIQVLEDTKEKGDRVRFNLIMQANGDGTTDLSILLQGTFTLTVDDFSL